MPRRPRNTSIGRRAGKKRRTGGAKSGAADRRRQWQRVGIAELHTSSRFASRSYREAQLVAAKRFSGEGGNSPPRSHSHTVLAFGAISSCTKPRILNSSTRSMLPGHLVDSPLPRYGVHHLCTKRAPTLWHAQPNRTGLIDYRTSLANVRASRSPGGQVPQGVRQAAATTRAKAVRFMPIRV
jgi:hypothetical protein